MIATTTMISTSVNPPAPGRVLCGRRARARGHALRMAGGYPVISIGVLYLEPRIALLWGHIGMQRLVHWMLRESWIAALELAIVVALALSLAVWTWQLFAPRTLAAPAPSSLGAGPVGAAPLAARSLLGASGASASATVRAGSGGALTLVGVFAAPAPGTGRALIARGGDRPQLVAAGEEIAPGVALNEVHADHVTVLRGGALERIELERRGAGGSQPLTPVQPQAPVRPRED